MSNLTIIYRSSKKTSVEKLLNLLGNENIEAIFNNSQLVFTSKDKVNTPKEKNNTKQKELEELVEKTPLDNFLEKHKITSFSKYTSKSLLLKSSYLSNVTPEEKIINSYELKRPLYYNVSLQGWISSLKNENILKKKILTKEVLGSHKVNKSKKNNKKESLSYHELEGYSFSIYKKVTQHVL